MKLAEKLGIKHLSDFGHVLKRGRNGLLKFKSDDPLLSQWGNVEPSPMWAAFYRSCKRI